MRFNCKKLWVSVGMFTLLITPLLAHADSVNINVNDNDGYHRHYHDDDYDNYSHFTWAIGLGGAALGDGFNSPGLTYNGGYGVDGNIGIKVNKTLSFLVAVDSYLFNTNYSNVYNGEINVMPSIRITLGNGDVKPYIVGGGGFNENISYYQGFYGTSSASTTNPVVGGGVGLAFKVGKRLDIYVQGKYEDVLASGGNFSYFPIALGVQFN